MESDEALLIANHYSGAMDLVANPEGTKIIVLMDHVAKGDKPKILDGTRNRSSK